MSLRVDGSRRRWLAAALRQRFDPGTADAAREVHELDRGRELAVAGVGMAEGVPPHEAMGGCQRALVVARALDDRDEGTGGRIPRPQAVTKP